jgi:hypothetical protein
LAWFEGVRAYYGSFKCNSAVKIPELKLDLECLKADMKLGRALDPFYIYLVDLALKATSENPKL